MDDRRFAELIELYLDNELSDADAADLRVYLEENPSAVSSLIEATKDHVLIRTAVRPNDHAIIAERARQLLTALPDEKRRQAAKRVMKRINRRRTIQFWARWGIVAAAALVVLYIQPWNWQTSATKARPNPTDGSLPHIIALTGQVHDGQGQTLQIGQLLADGVAIQTGDRGTATVLWPDGTSLAINHATHCEQLSATKQKLRLHKGMIVVRAAHRQIDKALIIESPDAQTQIVGTEFSISVHNGKSVLHVKEGLVQFTRKSDGMQRMVGSGERIGTDYMPTGPVFMSNEHIAAIRSAISEGRMPWTQTWEKLQHFAPRWAQEKIETPTTMIIYSWMNERSLHSQSRKIYGDAARKSLGLALAARLENNTTYAHMAAENIRAWAQVPVVGSDADYVIMDTATVFIQAADLIRRIGVWTSQDDALLENFIATTIEPRIPHMFNQKRERARWRALYARMLIAGWRGNKNSVQQDMLFLVDDCARIITPAWLEKVREEGEGTLLHTINQAMMASDIARTVGVIAEPPPNYQQALEWIRNEIDMGEQAEKRHAEIDPVIYGIPGWRLPLTHPLPAGPVPYNRIAFSWYFPTFVNLDPRLVP